MILVVGVIGVLCSLAFFLWFSLFRVPESLKGLPVVPGIWAKQSEKRRIACELAKTHAFARTWVFRWTLLVLHPEIAKVVENNSTLFEKQEGDRFPKFSFLKQFLGSSNVVSVQTQDWKRHRAVINPAFEFSYIRTFTPIFAEVADTLIAELKKTYKSTDPVPVHDWLQRYTLDCLGRTAFGFDFGSVKNPASEFAQTYHRLTDMTPGSRGIFFPPRLISPWGLYDLLPLNQNRQLTKDLTAWTDLLNRMVKLGETTAADSDLAAHLVKANKAGAVNYLTMEEIRSNLSVFFIAGHETSATSVASALWYLGRHQDVQEKAYQEVVRVCGKNEEPTFESQKELEYLTQVIYESNRLTPPVQFLPGRIAMEDTQLGDRQIKKGTLVSISIETLHYLEREWPNPTKFDPERFNPENHRNPFSWQPFGAGPRACLGRNFSVLEQRVVLAKLLQEFRIGLPIGAPDTIDVSERGLVRVWSNITVTPRN